MKKLTLLLSAMLMTVMSFGATTVTMDFTSKAGLDKLGIAYPVDSTTTDGAFQTELVAGQAYTQEGVSLTATHGSTPTRIWLAASGALDLRHYKTGVLTFAAPAGKVILKVKMAGGNVAGFADAPGGLWTGEASTVALTADAGASTIKIKTIEVTYGDAGEDIGGTTPPTPPTPPAEGVITCAEAVAICEATGSTATTETYTIRGYVTEIKYAYSEQYGTATFWIADTKDGGSVLQAYSCAPLTDADKVFAVGAYVELVGKLKQYNTTNEVEKGTYTVITPADGGTTPPTPPTPPVDPGKTTIEIPAEAQGWNIPAEAIDVLQARAICAGLEAGTTTGTKYYVMGYVKKIHSKHADGVANFGNAQFYMENVNGANSEEDFMAYQVYGLNGEKITDPNVVAVGDFVVVYGELTKYQYDATSTPVYETTGKGSAYIWNSTNPLIQPDPNKVTINDLEYADAAYHTESGVAYYDFDLYKGYDEDLDAYIYPRLVFSVKAKSKTAINGTYDLLYATIWTSENDSVLADSSAATVTIKNVDKNSNYSFAGSFVGTDAKTYKFNQVLNVYAFDSDYDEITLSEQEDTPPTPPTPPTDGAIVFDADVDKGNASMDSNNQTPYAVSKAGVTLDVTKGIIGTYNNENHYRIYKNQTLTITSTVGNIAKVEFTCTAEGDTQYGPGCFTVDGGDYTYSGAVGTWTGSAATIVFTASSNQVRASQIVVTLVGAGSDVENVVVGATPVKMIENGQLIIIRGDKVFNVLGAQVK